MKIAARIIIVFSLLYNVRAANIFLSTNSTLLVVAKRHGLYIV